MMFILTVIVGFFLMFIGALFTGWIYELVYELAIIPIVSCFNVTAPDIPFMLFVLLSLGIPHAHTKPQQIKSLIQSMILNFGVSGSAVSWLSCC